MVWSGNPYGTPLDSVTNFLMAQRGAFNAINQGANPERAPQQAITDARTADINAFQSNPLFNPGGPLYNPVAGQGSLPGVQQQSGLGQGQGPNNVNPYGPATDSFTNMPNYGWDNFSPGADQQAGYYNQLASWYQGQQAPQLQRTSIDWSGYGSGQGPAPSNPSGAPSMAGFPQFPTTMGQSGPYAAVQGTQTFGQPQGPGAPSYTNAPVIAAPPSSPGVPGTGAPSAGPAPSPYGQPSFGAISSLVGPQAYSGFGSGSSTGISAAGGPSVPTGGMHPLALSADAQTPVRPSLNQSAPSLGGLPQGSQAAPPLTQNPMPAGQPINGYVPNPAAGTGQALRPGTQAFPYGQSGQQVQVAGGPINGYVPNQAAGTGQPGDTRPPAPAQMGPGGIPSIGQYSNPLFQQSQQSRIGQQGVMGMTQNALSGATSNPLYGNTMQSRDSQLGYINQLNDVMSGRAPSQAQIQLRSGVDANIAAQNAMAAAAGPGQAGAASRLAMNNAAIANQNAAGQATQLRAQEYATALGQMGGATSNLRSADLGALQTSYQNSQNLLGQLNTASSQQRAADLQATGMSYQNALAQAQFEAQQNANQAQLQSTQQGQNNQAALGLLGMGQATQSNDLASRMHYYDLMASKYANDRGLAQQASQFNTQQSNLLLGAGLSAGGAVLGSMLGPGGTLAGGALGGAAGKALGGG